MLHKKRKWCLCVSRFMCISISTSGAGGKCFKNNSVSGSLGCSLRVSLHLWGIGPTNGTRPVGLRIKTRKAPGRLTDAVHNDSLITASYMYSKQYPYANYTCTTILLQAWDLPSTICPRTSHGTHGCRAGLAVAGGTQNHSYTPRTCSQINISI